ncbi:MAG: nucleotidyltransferase family protein [Clostridiales bacterium]|nr:nucleotidyltransferase family protein [Clostridiales bacterium]
MRVIGIVAEYNPFHNGHEYLIRKAREIVNDPRAIVLVVMSGPFTQRGLPSVLPKDVRAKQALMCGADVVLELPFTFACAPSERFAFGAIETLYRTGVVTDIAFGIDSDNFDLLKRLSETDLDNNESFTASLKKNLEDGMSFPSARANAIADVFEYEDKEELRNTLRRPNSILALDYLRAIRIFRKNFNVIAIPRVGDDYDAADVGSKYPSATAIRDIIKGCGNSQSALGTKLTGLMPDSSLAVMLSALSMKKYSFPDMDLYAKSAVMKLDSADETTAYMGDGLLGHIRNTCEKLRSGESDFDTLMSKLNTKHFTQGRILRAMASMMTDQSEKFISEHKHVPYIRVLGFNREGRYCLKIMGKCAKVPLIHNCSDFLEHPDEEITSVSALDKKAANLQNVLMGLPLNTDWDIPPVSVK